MKRMKDEAGKMETVRVSEEVLAKINEAKRYEEDPGQPLSVAIERIKKQSKGWQTEQANKIKSA